MKNAKLLFISVLSALLLVGCGDNGEVDETPAGDPTVSLTANAVVIHPSGTKAAAGATNEVIITSSADWELIGNSEWCTPSATSGKSGATVTFTATQNEEEAERELNLYFTCGEVSEKVNIKQQAKTVLEYTDIKDDYTVSYTGGNITIKLTTNLDVNNSETTQEWIKMEPDASSSQTKILQFAVEPNKTFADRNGQIILFKGADEERTIDVKQELFEGVIVEQGYDYTFGVDGGTTTIEAVGTKSFSADVQTAYQSWLTVEEKTSNTSGVITTKTFEITCTPNNSNRKGIIEVGGHNFVVYQINPDNVVYNIPDPIFADRLGVDDLGFIEEWMDGYCLTQKGVDYSGALDFSKYGDPYDDMKSVEGIEALKNITTLTLKRTSVRKVDVSKNPKITKVSLSYSPIEEIILGDAAVSSIEIVRAFNVGVEPNVFSTSITVSGTKITSLRADHTESHGADNDKVEYIDISDCPALTKLDCSRVGTYVGEDSKTHSVLRTIYLSPAQKAAYDGGSLTITTDAVFDGEIVVKQ